MMGKISKPKANKRVSPGYEVGMVVEGSGKVLTMTFQLTILKLL